MKVTRKNKNIKFILIAITLLLIVSLLFINEKKPSILKNINNSIIKVLNIIEKPFKKLNESWKIKNETINENDILKKECNNITALKEKEKSLEEEILKLKSLLELKQTYTNYDVITSTVISRNDTYWFNDITIDKGSEHNINKGDIVLTDKGMVGIINELSKDYSRVKLITSTNNEISVKVKGEEEYIAKIEKYKDNYIIISGLSSYDKIKINDKVVSSGFSKTYEEVPIGSISKIETDSYEMSKILYVKPYEDFNNLKYVSILRRTK